MLIHGWTGRMEIPWNGMEVGRGVNYAVWYGVRCGETGGEKKKKGCEYYSERMTLE
jgi:hypothetical protein